jgi:hypothetical protein
LYGSGPTIATDCDQLVVARTGFPSDGHRQSVRANKYAVDPLSCAGCNHIHQRMPQRLCDCYVHNAVLLARVWFEDGFVRRVVREMEFIHNVGGPTHPVINDDPHQFGERIRTIRTTPNG